MRNVIASKRGWGYDYANSLLNAYVDGVALVKLSATTTGGTASLGVSMTFTQTTAVSHAALEGIVTYTPSTAGSGGAVPIGIRSKVILSGSCTSTLYMYGLQSQLHLEASSVLNGSMYAALRAVLTSDASPTFSGGTLAVLYVENLIAQSMTGINSSMIRIANNGGGNGNIDTVFECSTPEIPVLFSFTGGNNAYIEGLGGVTGHGGIVRTIKCLHESVTYYLLMSTIPT